MTDFEQYTLILSSTSVLITFTGLFYAGFQLRKAQKNIDASYKINNSIHDWNRREAAQNALKQYDQSILTSALQSKFDYLSCTESIPLKTIEEEFSDNENMQKDLHQLLNYYESLARGVYQEIYDKEVIKSGRKTAMSRVLRAFKSYIDKSRIRTGSTKLWSELESLVSEWYLEENKIAARSPTNIQP
jgi:RecG-like helicase